MSTNENILGGRGLAAGSLRAERNARLARLLTFDVWFVLLLFIGLAVVIIDGLTRTFPPIETANPIDMLQYEPFVGAFVFAALSFPLVLLHARRAGASFTLSILLWFVLGTVTYAKDFSYIQFYPDVPIYITDVVLLLIMLSLFVWPALRMFNLRSPVIIALLLFVAAGGFGFVRGVAGGQEITRCFRDLAIVVYVAYFLIGMYLVKSWDAIRHVMKMVLVGSLFTSALGLTWFIAQPDGRRYIAFGIYVACALVGVAIMMLKQLLPPALAVPLGFVLLLGLFVANQRSLYVCLAAAGLVIVLTARLIDKRLRAKRMLKVGLWFGAAGLVMILLLSQTRAGSAYIQRESDQLVSGLLTPEDDDNAQFRLLAWAEAGFRFFSNPLIGEGFGIPFTFELTQADARPHNTYLTIVYKLGVTGITPFLFALLYVFGKAARALRRASDDPHAYLLHVLVLSQVMLCVFGGLNLLLESPFLASIFWLNLGMTWRASVLLERSHPPALARAA